MKRVLIGGIFVAFFVSSTPAIADGGILPISTAQPIAENQYDVLVNKLVTRVLQTLEWKNSDGEITFTESGYSVQYNCNTLFGTYAVDGLTANFSAPAMTKMACDTKDMEADSQLAKDLRQVETLTFADGQLVLTGKDTTLSFDAGLAASN